MTRSSRFVLLALVLSMVCSCGNDKKSPTQPGMSPTATPTPVAGSAHTVNVGPGGGNTFVDATSGNSTTTISAGQTVKWAWVGGLHSTTSGNCCTPDGIWDSGNQSGGNFSHTFAAPGTFPYYCRVHGAMMTGTVVVNP